MPNNFSTLQSWATLDLHTLKKAGADEYHGPCPVTGAGTDCFWVKPDARLIGCRGCAVNGLSGPQFTEHLSAIGGASGESVSLQTYDWTNYLTGEIVTQTRHVGEPKYRWPKGVTLRGLVYLARHDRTADRPLVFAEGAKAATAAASKLPTADYDVIGFVSSTTIPSADTLTALAKGRSCIVWPDDDPPGAKVATRLVSALARSAADVVTVDPERLGLTGGRGDDAAEWHPGSSPGEELRAACEGVQQGDASPLPMDTSEQVRLWAEDLTNADIDGTRRILRTIAAAPAWQQLAVDLRIEVVGAIKGPTEKSIATVILGRFDDRTLAWRNPPTEAVDTSDPDVVSLETLLADPLDPTAVVARGLAFGGTMGFIRGPKASGKTTILAAAAARVSCGEPWAGHPTEARHGVGRDRR